MTCLQSECIPVTAVRSLCGMLGIWNAMEFLWSQENISASRGLIKLLSEICPEIPEKKGIITLSSGVMLHQTFWKTAINRWEIMV